MLYGYVTNKIYCDWIYTIQNLSTGNGVAEKNHTGEKKSLEEECPDWVGVAICNRELETSYVVFRVPEHMVDFWEVLQGAAWMAVDV